MNTRIFLREQYKNSIIWVDITGNGLRLKLSTGIKISKNDWNSLKKEVRGNDILAATYNSKLRDIEHTVNKLTIDSIINKTPVTVIKLKNLLKNIIDDAKVLIEEPVIKATVFNNLLRLVEDYLVRQPKKLSANTYKSQKSFHKILKDYAKENGIESLNFENIDITFEENFTKFLYARNYNINYVDKLKLQVKYFMNYATDKEWNTKLKYKKFTRAHDETDTISLNWSNYN
jgi:hypothetical protein